MSGTGHLQQASDEKLVELCNHGDAASAESAFNVLYERHKQFVLKTARSIVHDDGLALDALQETFVYLLRQFPPTGEGLTLTARLTTYLYPIARNTAISQWRKAARLAGSVDADELPAMQEQSGSDVEAALRELTFERREIVTMRFLRDMSLKDIAAALDIPLGTAKSRLHAAVEQLRKSPEVRQFFEK